MRLRTSIAILLFVIAATSVWAGVTPVDLQVAARALSFLERPLSVNVRLGILYVSGDDQSVRAADAVVNLLGDGMKAGNLLLRPVVVSVDHAMTAQVDAFFLPDGMGDRARQVAEATAKKKIPCFTLDIPQVEAGNCVMGVRVLPKVQIYVNRAAATASDTAFVSVFRMMITEF
jgi:hypothetical protein